MRQSCYLLIQTHSLMKSKLKMYTKIFGKTKTNLTTVITPKAHRILIRQIKKVIGKFKDEAAGVPICELVGVRSKMYSYMKDNQKGGKTAKGIKKNVIKKDIQHENYKETLFNNKQMYHKMKTIRSESNKIGSYEINKVSLSCFDDKRYIHEDGKTSYAYGHKNIKH